MLVQVGREAVKPEKAEQEIGKKTAPLAFPILFPRECEYDDLLGFGLESLESVLEREEAVHRLARW